jgi:low temperature requirement protein LtrA
MTDISAPSVEELHHHKRRMGGRDLHEEHRAATPLELLFDLTFVVAFAQAASQFAHAVAEDHISSGLLGFSSACFAICWAWINFSWFASAYDTDDWIFRLTTMVQMIGVLILALGLPPAFASIEKGAHLDNSIMVLGYVVMRVAMIFQWLRAAKQDPARRKICLTYVKAITIAQLGWIILIFLDFSIGVTLAMAAVFTLVEMAGPYLAERIDAGTPWHAHHIAERYALFTIIALGEGIVGTVAALAAVIESEGWTLDVAMVGLAGVGLTFGMWWVYFILPSGYVLHVNRNKSFGWGYGHMVPIASIVATGAGLHVAAYYIEHKAKIGPMATVLSVAIPVSIFLVSIYAIYAYLVQTFDRFHLLLITATAVVVATSIAAASFGVSMPVCLLILMLAPVVTVVGYETRGHKHQAASLNRHSSSSDHVADTL